MSSATSRRTHSFLKREGRIDGKSMGGTLSLPFFSTEARAPLSTNQQLPNELLLCVVHPPARRASSRLPPCVQSEVSEDQRPRGCPAQY